MKINAIIPVIIVALSASLAMPVKSDDIGKPGTPNGPPAGIAPVTVTLESVLRAYEAARGITAHPTLTDIEQGTINAYGMHGTYRDVYAGLRSGSLAYKSRTFTICYRKVIANSC